MPDHTVCMCIIYSGWKNFFGYLEKWEMKAATSDGFCPIEKKITPKQKTITGLKFTGMSPFL